MPRLTAALLVLLSAIALAAPAPNVLDGKGEREIGST